MVTQLGLWWGAQGLHRGGKCGGAKGKQGCLQERETRQQEMPPEQSRRLLETNCQK